MPRAAKKKSEIDPAGTYVCWQSGAALVDGEVFTFHAGERLSGDSPLVQATYLWTTTASCATTGGRSASFAARGRPVNSPGWGMLGAVKSGAFTSERNPRERATIKAGTTRVSRDYWLAAERPELFMPIDERDTRTIDAHRSNLGRARRDLERGRTATRRTTDQTRPGVLPARRPAVGLRWPRPRPHAPVLP
jgi:hypothetical protein